MPKPRFKALRASQTTRYKGVITRTDLEKHFGIPKDAEVTFQVPGGADWSGMAIDIDDKECAIQVTWEEVK